MKNYINQLLILTILLGLLSCNKEEEDLITAGCTDYNASNFNPLATVDDGSCIYSFPGCTNPDALNYNIEATEDDGSCIILGCTDNLATNYNPDATNDDGSCEYSNASILNGTWNIISLEYSTEIDLTDVPTVGPLIGVQDISGEAINAGEWTFEYPAYIYSNNLNFTTEPITILTFDVPGIPIDVASNGTWSLINNDNTLLTTDEVNNMDSYYSIISLTSTTAIISGVVPFSQEIMGLPINLEIDMEMILEKQ
ncbi:MAG: hypothetical protein CMP49_03835 [Flavobacteriales bacterium]|jgi:hypothetical protein|nr:hypothetical protein [Flavobacteriales bacterium]|tara:strand:- start:25939 stop:26700 length:762 start_codon:yes stop_codon:yes gene_type:complete